MPKNTSPSAPGKSLAWSVRDEDLDDLEALKRDLLNKAAEAQSDGRLYLASQYTVIVASISPEIKRIRDRFDRETLANIRREQKELKLQARDAQQAADEGNEES